MKGKLNNPPNFLVDVATGLGATTLFLLITYSIAEFINFRWLYVIMSFPIGLMIIGGILYISSLVGEIINGRDSDGR